MLNSVTRMQMIWEKKDNYNTVTYFVPNLIVSRVFNIRCFTCQRVMHAYMPRYLCILRTYVPMCFCILRAFVFYALTCLCAYMPTWTCILHTTATDSFTLTCIVKLLFVLIVGIYPWIIFNLAWRKAALWYLWIYTVNMIEISNKCELKVSSNISEEEVSAIFSWQYTSAPNRYDQISYSAFISTD